MGPVMARHSRHGPSRAPPSWPVMARRGPRPKLQAPGLSAGGGPWPTVGRTDQTDGSDGRIGRTDRTVGFYLVWHQIAGAISFNSPYKLSKMVEHELANQNFRFCLDLQIWRRRIGVGLA
jgi:hypothetical protein